MPFAQIRIHPWGTLMFHLQQLNRVTDDRDTSFPHDPGTQGWVEQRKVQGYNTTKGYSIWLIQLYDISQVNLLTQKSFERTGSF
jgi:hypothetical protein